MTGLNSLKFPFLKPYPVEMESVRLKRRYNTIRVIEIISISLSSGMDLSFFSLKKKMYKTLNGANSDLWNVSEFRIEKERIGYEKIYFSVRFF